MNWPFVRRSKYINEKTLRISNKEEAELYKSQIITKNKMLAELTGIKQDVGILRAMIDASQLRNADLNIENKKLKEVNTGLVFAKKDLKQKIRKLESDNSKLKSKNGALDSHCKWLYGNFRRFKEQMEKSGYFKN